MTSDNEIDLSDVQFILKLHACMTGMAFRSLPSRVSDPEHLLNYGVIHVETTSARERASSLNRF